MPAPAAELLTSHRHPLRPQISGMLKTVAAIREAVATPSLSPAQLSQAVKEVDQLSTLTPFCPNMRLWRAQLQLRAGNFAAALACCELIVMDAPFSGAPVLPSTLWRYWLAAQAKYHQGELVAAIAEVRTCVHACLRGLRLLSLCCW